MLSFSYQKACINIKETDTTDMLLLIINSFIYLTVCYKENISSLSNKRVFFYVKTLDCL
jgi:hypothetical protein